MDTEKKVSIQEAFRYFKAHPKLPHVEVQQKLVELLGKDFVSRAWREARRLLEQAGGQRGDGERFSPDKPPSSRQQHQLPHQEQGAARAPLQQPQGGQVVEALDDLDLINAQQATGEDIESDITREADLECIVREEDEGLLEHIQPLRMLSAKEAETWEFKHVMDGELVRKALRRAERREEERLSARTVRCANGGEKGKLGMGAEDQGRKKLVGEGKGKVEEKERQEEPEEDESLGRARAVEALSRACQDYATGLLEDLVRLAKQRENEDVRHLVREGATLGAQEPMVVRFLAPYELPGRKNADENEAEEEQEQQGKGQHRNGEATESLRPEEGHILRRTDVVRYLGRKQRRGRRQGHDRLIDMLATTNVKRGELSRGASGQAHLRGPSIKGRYS